nr:AAA family ATPase [uncultured Agathobacter sp.]
MPKTIGIGKQDFVSIIEDNCFFIDKTNFIKEWWDSKDDVTLITRPRRFGKTLNMSMLNCFFSNQYKNRNDLFKGLSIWINEDYREIQGTYPVIFMSFASVKADNINDTKIQIKAQIESVFKKHRYLLTGDTLTSEEKQDFENTNIHMGDAESGLKLNILCEYFYRYWGQKTIIILDEYDTPMQEAYLHGYWTEFTSYIRSLFNATFKTNPYMERAIMTGITRVSKESIFSDLNNLTVVTTTSNRYATSFGFTEDEVFLAMDEYGLSEERNSVKKWYDGFKFGDQNDIYNPWSITNFLKEKQISPYWASTSSNGLVNRLIRTASADIKSKMETLLDGGSVEVNFDEQLIFEQLDNDENAIWSLLLACGYLKVDSLEKRGLTLDPWYSLSITNLETVSMFSNMFRGWFNTSISNYNGFIKALLQGNVREMNIYMNEVALSTFSSFDTGNHPSGKSEPERFYHGFVLGLLVELRDKYEVKYNRESGYGRYDVMLIPYNKNSHAIVMEFKVIDPDEENSLDETANSALQQIDDKNYDTELLSQGYDKKSIQHYGFAFEGKKVLIKQG